LLLGQRYAWRSRLFPGFSARREKNTFSRVFLETAAKAINQSINQYCVLNARLTQLSLRTMPETKEQNNEKKPAK